MMITSAFTTDTVRGVNEIC